MTLSPETFLSFGQLSNPVLAYSNWSIKDCACVYHEPAESFYLFFSAFYEDDGMVRSHVVEVATKDFLTFSEPILHLDGKDEGWTGMCSPEIVKAEGVYYLTFNSWGDQAGRPNQLFYKTSTDLIHWSEGFQPLAANLTQGNRAIDSSLIYENGLFYLFWKERTAEDRTRLASSAALSGDFAYIGDGYPQFLMQDGKDNGLIHENFCFLKVDGQWRMITTDYKKDSFAFHNSYLYTLKTAGENPLDFLTWESGYQLDVQQESFNADHRANAAALYDWRKYDGHFYLLYAGNTENESFATRGHNRLGLSRSKDLLQWSPAGQTP
ncbi:hypothetical protein EBB07_11795 [Paenibacillaceae bacterium]|nr:hypothetical protein EBB07_11795 [Paenibacillaceae bacterium]